MVNPPKFSRLVSSSQSCRFLGVLRLRSGGFPDAAPSEIERELVGDEGIGIQRRATTARQLKRKGR
jgi:hypothetical protein